MSCQIFSGNDATSGAITTSAEAIKYAADNGAAIIQCSFGSKAGTYTSDSAYERGSGVQYNAIKYFIESQNCDAVDGGVVILPPATMLLPCRATRGLTTIISP